MGSTDAVSKIKWLYNADKAGHAGTLDPLASGMLPIALGEATKTVPYVMDGTKIYRFTVAWGEERTTDDLEGTAVHSSDERPVKDDILALLPKYTGVIMQKPPTFRRSRSPANAPTTWRAKGKPSTSPNESRDRPVRAGRTARRRSCRLRG
jgi:tRNA pseudouridine(55) synthase